jgi:hypothetical protein
VCTDQLTRQTSLGCPLSFVLSLESIPTLHLKTDDCSYPFFVRRSDQPELSFTAAAFENRIHHLSSNYTSRKQLGLNTDTHCNARLTPTSL